MKPTPLAGPAGRRVRLVASVGRTEETVPISIHGWIEVTRHDEPERSREHAWMGAVNLGAIVDVRDPISERLFGFGRHPLAEHRGFEAIAAGRGLPAFPSEQVERDIATIRALAARTGQEECGGYTHVGWREITEAGLTETELRGSDWATVFDVVRTLERGERIGPDRIRVVVYYCV